MPPAHWSGSEPRRVLALDGSLVGPVPHGLDGSAFRELYRWMVVARRLERSLKRAGHEHRERQLAIRVHPGVALYLLEEEPKFLQTVQKATGLDLELRDDPMMRLDEFRLMSRPAGRDVTELYAVA